VPTSHRLAQRGPVRLRDLGDEALIALKPAYGLRELTDRLLRTAHARTTYAFESQDIATASGLVASGLGLALLPAGSQAEGTVELPIADDGATRTISLVWRQDRPATAPISDLRRLIINDAPELLSAVAGP
jgi:LysR family transcriptional regulator, transcription activator of glutamate synthase operon